MEMAFQILVITLLTGGLYALLAMGFSLIYGVARIINLAHTAFYMVSAYLIYVIINFLGVPLILSAVIAVIVTIGIGIAFYRFLIDPIKEHELTVLMVTTATALLIQEATKMIFTAQRRSIPMFVSGSFDVFGMAVTYQYLITLGVAAIALVAVWLWMTRSKIGIAIRCTAQDREAANLIGINVRQVFLITTAVSIALAAICGAIVAPIYMVEPGMWAHPLVMMLGVVVLGGLGSVKGGVAGAFIMAFVETMVVFLSPEGSYIKSAVALAVMVAVLLIRPEGLFGVKFEEERL